MGLYIIADPIEKNVSDLEFLILKVDQQANILHTKSGSGIFTLLNSEIPEVIFINHQLSDISGFEVCKKIKSDFSPSIPLILLIDNPESVDNGNEIVHSSVDALLIRPIVEMSLRVQLNTLNKIYKQHQQNNEARQFTYHENSHTESEISKTLSESTESYRNLVERLPDGVYKSTHDGKFLEVNPAMVKMLGYDSKEDLMSIDIKAELYFQPEDREIYGSQKILEGIGVFRLRKKDGTEIWVEDHGWYTLNEEGEILFHEGILRNITDRRMSEQILSESEERFKMLFDKAPIGYQSIDGNGYLLEVNETWLEMMGYQKNEVLGHWFGEFLTPESANSFNSKCKSFQYERTFKAEFEMIRKDGSVIKIHLQGRIGNTTSGAIKQTHCVISDITDQRRIETEIADERILLRTLIDNIPDIIYVKDLNGRKIISNKADLELLGFRDEKEVLGKTDSELLDPELAVQTWIDDFHVIQTAQPILNKLQLFPGTNGTQKFISTSKVPLTNESGEIIGLVGVGHDITREKQTEQKLHQLSKGMEQSPASIIITDTGGNIEYVNSKFSEITGYPFDEVKGKSPTILQSGHTARKEYERLWGTIAGGNEYHGELLNRKRNGELFWESVLISPIRNEAGKITHYMAIKEDITDRKKADLEIRKLSVAIDQNPASVIITNTEGIIEYVNKKFIAISGYTSDKLIGNVVRILKPGHTSEETYIEIWNNLLAGREWRGEHQNRKKNKERYWESVLISPIKNNDGKITNFIILSEDISERKKMEKELITAKEKAEESDRLKSAFLANMSHEIRTPLNSILGFSDLLTEQNLNDQARHEYANLITSSGSNLLAIINDVLDISKIEAGQITLSMTQFSAQRLIHTIRNEYAHKALSKNLELRIEISPEARKIYLESDEMRIKQVLVNFVGNALKFTEKGFIEIGLQYTETEIRFHVKDTGIGISKEYHHKIFDRFRQVEAANTRKYGGNGLGLAITKNLAELLGGRIWLESEPKKGSTFYFALPQSCIVDF
jgi:PAS domain S-box-containing protein